MRLVVLAAVALATFAGCQQRTPVTAGNDVAYTDEGATQLSEYEGREPKIEIRTSGGRWLVTAYQGLKNTGGYAIRIDKVTVGGTVLRVHARFTEPASDVIVTQVLTSPAHAIGIPFGPDVAILFDQDDRERARTTPK